jgi:hypothetical protein
MRSDGICFSAQRDILAHFWVGSPAERQNSMKDETQCRALKRDGRRCTNQSKFGGFCGVHFPGKADGANLSISDQIARVANIVAIAAGSIEIVRAIVQVWQSLPFGSSPKMPNDYNILVAQMGPSRPEFPDKYQPFSKGPDSVNWKLAREIYEAAQKVRTAPPSDPAVALQMWRALDARINGLLDTMPEPMQNLLYSKVGKRED